MSGTTAEQKPRARRSISKNRKVYFDYFVEEEYEAGMVLTGSELKSIRAGQVNLEEGHVHFDVAGNAVLLNAHIKEYERAGAFGHEARRTRRLLLSKRELARLALAMARKGYAIMPLELFFSGPWVKLRIALCRGKKKYDKRDVMRERDIDRDVDRASKDFKNKERR